MPNRVQGVLRTILRSLAQGAPQLCSFQYRNTTASVDLSELAALTSLTSLQAEVMGSTSCLGTLTKLQCLGVFANYRHGEVKGKLTDLTVLGGLTSLNLDTLLDDTASGLSALKSLTHLKRLDLLSMPSGMVSCLNLVHLEGLPVTSFTMYLRERSSETDIAAADAWLRHSADCLITLRVVGRYALGGVSEVCNGIVEGAPQLRMLILSGLDLSHENVAHITKLTKLTRLVLDDCNLPTSDLRTGPSAEMLLRSSLGPTCTLHIMPCGSG